MANQTSTRFGFGRLAAVSGLSMVAVILPAWSGDGSAWLYFGYDLARVGLFVLATGLSRGFKVNTTHVNLIFSKRHTNQTRPSLDRQWIYKRGEMK